MSSILTNTGAMTALQTLKMVNRDLGATQGMISTGKRVATAKDNAAVWAISKAMESDVAGFKRISDSLSLGQATIDVARNGAETVTDLLTQIKGKIVASQEENVDRTKIQADIDALRDQVSAVVNASQFNGQYMLQNTSTDANSGGINVLASIDRASDGSVTSTDIRVAKQDLGTGAQSVSATGGTFTASEATGTLNATQSVNIDLSGVTVEAGKAFALQIFGTDADDSSFTQADYRNSAAAAMTQAEAAGASVVYVARDGETAEDVAGKLAEMYATYVAEQGLDTNDFNVTANGSGLTVTSGVTNATDTIAVTVASVGADANNTIGGRLQALADIDVTTQSGADSALASIDGLIDTAIDSAAAFGSAQMRIETQSDFVTGLTDALKSGIGTLVDADMEETSARLQALQVQQQLAVQAMSIANNAPQSLLSLFR
ncbi:flagellin [Sagittula sp. S175]|uniref:flagellin N-terminal helical domain-containing protein n=1 Tax=Sagittula sp. S175 TaxID=3415129 RepID=UPI003C7ECFF2